ncbi:MAG: M24 family metallopeptidase, partial [Candidatus Aenigmatarchaeota archaeon]
KKITFQPGMVFTIEPGIYIKGVGGCRIENDVLIMKKGIKILTSSNLIEVLY